ncbi:MAG: toxin-activating lysine-acyltransferase [Hyphomicrobiaceae bacterium]
MPAATASSAPAPEPAPAATPVRSNRTEAEALGKVMAILLRSPQHRNFTLGDVDSRIVPALQRGQFAIAEANPAANPAGGGNTAMPVGLVLWAEVSQAVSERLAATPEKPIVLAADEWRSGDNVWIVEAAGSREVIAALLGRLQSANFKGRALHMRVRNREGRAAIATFNTPPQTPPPATGTPPSDTLT